MAFDWITSVLDIGTKIIDRVIPDPAQKAAAQLELLKLQQSGDLVRLTAETDLAKGQMAINQIEAGSEKWWKAGWRPFVGWVCGLSLASNYFISSFFTWASALFGHPTPYPTIDMTTMLPLLAGLLGFGYFRGKQKGEV